MREVTASGKSVEEAVQSALEQLDTTKDHVNIEIIDEGKKGIFGLFGSKPAIIKAVVKRDPVKEAEKFLQDVISNMGLQVNIATNADGKRVTYDLQGEEIAILIGKRGQTLNALQYLTNLAINKDSDMYYTVTIDAEGYRERRKSALEGLAERSAEKAIATGRKVALDPMPAFERKIVHNAIQRRTDIKTHSNGNDPHRHIVIQPAE